ncbi:MAG: ATP-binding protein [Verrucomicrobiota bacterium]|nr:cyclic nucleotide-binding domain-containing protein [Verrucomicrobiota bacterium]
MVELESVELFGRLRPEEMAALRQVAVERVFATGQEIFREGAPGDGLYVVQEGRVEIAGQVQPHPRLVFSNIGPGGVFGEMAVIEQLPRSAGATAAEPTTVYFLPRAVVWSLIERSPALAGVFLQLISRRLREFNQHYLQEVVLAERLAAVGRFARSIVHDLKNPLNIISLTAEMYCQPEAPPALRATAQGRIQKQVGRINDLITDILQFSQGDQSTARVPVSYAVFIEQLAAELRPELETKSVRLDLEASFPALKLSLDAKRLRRVFINLVHNATDAMPSSGTITLRIRQDAREVVTEIADTGSGIAPEMQEKLFQPFATHGKGHGTGLGLSICKKIVEDHGGRIWARNDPAGGAVFAFSLPLPAQ